MTTVTRFQPTASGPFQFQATLDGQLYSVVIRWNVFRQGWYVNILDQFGNRIVNRALIGSPQPTPIDSLAWANNMVTAATCIPLEMVRGQVVDLTISGVTPDAYNGAMTCNVTGDSSFTYPLQTDPGPASVTGGVSVASYSISLTAGYFSSTLVFREATQNFEVSP